MYDEMTEALKLCICGNYVDQGYCQSTACEKERRYMQSQWCDDVNKEAKETVAKVRSYKAKSEVTFAINSNLSHVSLTCPYCEQDIIIHFDRLNPPKSWPDEWGDVECPYCGINGKITLVEDRYL